MNFHEARLAWSLWASSSNGWSWRRGVSGPWKLFLGTVLVNFWSSGWVRWHLLKDSQQGLDFLQPFYGFFDVFCYNFFQRFVSHDWTDEAANTSQRLLERNPFLSYIGPKGTCRFQAISQILGALPVLFLSWLIYLQVSTLTSRTMGSMRMFSSAYPSSSTQALSQSDRQGVEGFQFTLQAVLLSTEIHLWMHRYMWCWPHFCFVSIS